MIERFLVLESRRRLSAVEIAIGLRARRLNCRTAAAIESSGTDPGGVDDFAHYSAEASTSRTRFPLAIPPMAGCSSSGRSSSYREWTSAVRASMRAAIVSRLAACVACANHDYREFYPLHASILRALGGIYQT